MIEINADEIINASGTPMLIWEKILRNHNGIIRLNNPIKGFNGEDIWIKGDRNQHIKVRYNDKEIVLTPDNRVAYIECFKQLNYISKPKNFRVKLKSKIISFLQENIRSKIKINYERATIYIDDIIEGLIEIEKKLRGDNYQNNN